VDPIRVGICGFGTVGSGTFRVLERNRADIAARVGQRLDAWIDRRCVHW